MKRTILAILALGSLAAAALVPPLPQDPRYHRFADERTLLGIPHFMDVVSNLPFFVVGLAGLYNAAAKKDLYFPVPGTRGAWIVLALSIVATGAGSAYYHWAPSNETLFWDRLPMAVGFSSVLAILGWEWVDRRVGRLLWGPLLVAGVGSLVYARGRDDLRFYFLLQGWVIVFSPLILALFEAPATGTSFLVLGAALYGLAKICELFDAGLFGLTRVVSGHTFKHLAAAAASGFLLAHLVRRRPL